ncbi:hypothetical protein GCM10020221_11530 [Streptomyces thioluteus]|uniref:DNA (cytosine-5-)-methyltransferase n=1 Tax=Streptomyces thioluteus TaxID=66431 RepID=A0ABN3WJN4_STRTU
MKDNPIPILELCAGYGGLGRAVESLIGDRITYVAEIDPHASLILQARYPNAPNLGDVRDIDWPSLRGQVDVITAGFPCQDISHAGRRTGLHGERSSLWFSILEGIRILRPELVFLENVSALRNRGLPTVLGGLAEIGYDARWCCYRASGAGAPPPSRPLVLHRHTYQHPQHLTPTADPTTPNRSAPAPEETT